MKLSSSSTALLPPAEDFTRNGDVCGGAVASFDLLCLPGLVMSFLDDSTATQSSGEGCSARQLYVADAASPPAAERLSSGTTDSSMLFLGAALEPVQPGGCARQFKFPVRDAVSADLAALMLLLGNFVMMLLQPEMHTQEQAKTAQSFEIE